MLLVSLQVTEKTDAYVDNLRVGLELWEKQLMLGGEVDSWAGAKLALFAESHPFHNEQQVLDMTVRFPRKYNSYYFTGSFPKSHRRSLNFHNKVQMYFSLLCRMRSMPMRGTSSISTRSL